MKKLLISTLVSATTTLLLTINMASAGEKYNLTLAGASPGGLWSTIGAGLDKSLNKAYPGSTVTYQTSSGGLANAKLVADGKVPMGLAADMELAPAYRGTGPFAGKAMKDLRVLFRVYNSDARFQLVHVLVNGDAAKQYGIKSMADLRKNAGKLRIAVNRPGNMDGDLGLAILAAHNIKQGQIKKLVRAASKEQTSLMLDRRIDVMVVGLPLNHRRIREIRKGFNENLVLLDVGAQQSSKIAKDFDIKACKIKAKEKYPFLNNGVNTVCAGVVIVVNKNMPEKTAYNIVSGVLKNLGDFQSAHRALKKATSSKVMAESSVAPHHPGAVKAFKEAGLL